MQQRFDYNFVSTPDLHVSGTFVVSTWEGLKGDNPGANWETMNEGEWVPMRVALQQLCSGLSSHVPAPGAPGLPRAVRGGLPRTLPAW